MKITNKSFLTALLIVGALAPCSLYGFFFSISVLGNHGTGDIIVLVADLYGQKSDYVETAQSNMECSVELNKLFVQIVNNSPLRLYRGAHAEHIKKVLTRERGYEELAYYGMLHEPFDSDPEAIARLCLEVFSSPQFEQVMLSTLQEVCGLTHEGLWALELEPKPHRKVKSKL